MNINQKVTIHPNSYHPQGKYTIMTIGRKWISLLGDDGTMIKVTKFSILENGYWHI